MREKNMRQKWFFFFENRIMPVVVEHVNELSKKD